MTDATLRHAARAYAELKLRDERRKLLLVALRHARDAVTVPADANDEAKADAWRRMCVGQLQHVTNYMVGENVDPAVVQPLVELQAELMGICLGAESPAMRPSRSRGAKGPPAMTRTAYRAQAAAAVSVLIDPHAGPPDAPVPLDEALRLVARRVGDNAGALKSFRSRLMRERVAGDPARQGTIAVARRIHDETVAAVAEVAALKGHRAAANIVLAAIQTRAL